MAGVSATYVHAALKLSRDESVCVDAGLRPLVEPKSSSLTTEPAAKPTATVAMSDAEVVADIVSRVGQDRMLELVVAAGFETA